MRGFGHADVWVILQVPGNKADTVPCERLRKEIIMNVSSVPSTTMASAAAAQQLQAVMEMQVAMLKELAESQEQVSQLLVESGLGQSVNVHV